MRSASEKAAAVSALRNDSKQMELRAGAKKTLKLTVECLRCSRFVPSSLFNCGIWVEHFDVLRIVKIAQILPHVFGQAVTGTAVL
jgi:hypothetical protein